MQGEGSFVKLRALPYGMVTSRAKINQDDMAAVLAFNEEFLAAVVVDWNWVDDDGKQLPLPADDPKVLNRLVIPEFEFIARSAGLDAQAKKV